MKKIIQKLFTELTTIKETQSKILDVSVNDSINELVGSVCKNPTPVLISETFKMKIASGGNNELYLLQKQLSRSYAVILESVIELNDTLLKPEQKILDIKNIQQKELITVDEFILLFSYSKESQKGYRTRLHNPLPYIQKSHGSKIFYDLNEVKTWLKDS